MKPRMESDWRLAKSEILIQLLLAAADDEIVPALAGKHFDVMGNATKGFWMSPTIQPTIGSTRRNACAKRLLR